MSVSELEQLGYDVVTPHRMFGRSSELMSGNPIFEGGYRAASPDVIFGEDSVLVDADPVTLLEPSLAQSPIYHLFILVSFILYLHMLLRSWNFIGAIWGDIFSVHSERRMANEGGELPLSYFKVAAIIVGVLTLSLVGVRIADIVLSSDSPLYGSAFELLSPVVSLLFVLVFVAWIYALHTITGWVTLSPIADELASISLINFVRYIVLLFPLVATWLVVPIDEFQGWSIALLLGTAVILLIYLKDTFVFFLAKKIPILYWFLYLCTAFLLPLSFVVTMLRG